MVFPKHFLKLDVMKGLTLTSQKLFSVAWKEKFMFDQCNRVLWSVFKKQQLAIICLAMKVSRISSKFIYFVEILFPSVAK